MISIYERLLHVPTASRSLRWANFRTSSFISSYLTPRHPRHPNASFSDLSSGKSNELDRLIAVVFEPPLTKRILLDFKNFDLDYVKHVLYPFEKPFCVCTRVLGLFVLPQDLDMLHDVEVLGRSLVEALEPKLKQSGASARTNPTDSLRVSVFFAIYF